MTRENVNNTLTNQQVFNQKAFNFLSPVMYLVMYFLTLGIYFIGAILINEANMGDKIVLFGNMIVFSSYAMQVIMSFLMLAMIFMMLPRASVSAKRINEVLDTPISVNEGNVTMNNSDIKGCVEFKNVSFKYPDADEYVLEDISFKVNKGETIAFIGSTGSGKSTLNNIDNNFDNAKLDIDGRSEDITTDDLYKIYPLLKDIVVPNDYNIDGIIKCYLFNDDTGKYDKLYGYNIIYSGGNNKYIDIFILIDTTKRLRCFGIDTDEMKSSIINGNSIKIMGEDKNYYAIFSYNNINFDIETTGEESATRYYSSMST